ncbi:MAG: CxxxxCH/CxxCH domain-containing protein [Nitrospiraceae bacterium]|nr:MAG: CxxxxCH/CxxCH domain-containing protein [Nitrospiraceae bacterium]
MLRDKDKERVNNSDKIKTGLSLINKFKMQSLMIFRVLFFSVLFILMATRADALDYPHNSGEGIACDSCHYVWGSQPSLMIEGLTYGQNIDDTEYNALCWSCHDNITAPLVKTHSSLQIDNGYGNWTVECRVCHNPHGHKQFRTYGSASYLYQGTVSSVNATSLTRTAAGWTDDQYQGLILVPNTAQNSYNYKITGNTSDTLTVEGTIDLTKVSSGNTFIIVYGSLIREKITTPNSGIKPVRFFNSTGTNSFADGDATYDGVCEVCHTQTTHHQNDVTGNHTHNASLNCTTCHSHTKGFKMACDICHGNPPTVNTATGGPNGLVNNPGVTGSSTAGAHNVHVNTKGFDCAVCHYNSAGSGSTHNNGLSVTMGFYLFSGSYQGGSYDGQSGVTYNAATTAPVTSVSNNNNKTCSNVYCHSTGQSITNGSSSTPTYASPVWDNSASGVCGTCHKVTEASGLTSGSHGAHLGTTGVNGCGNCHTGAANDASAYSSANHINTSIDVANTYTAGGTPGNGYGTCSTAPCHEDGTGNLMTTPIWGTPGAGCSECHAEVPATGNHTKHVTTTLYSTAACGDCHDSAVQGTTPPEQHLDSNIDVYDSTAGDLGYPQNVAKGGAPYDTCTTAYCHSTGQSTTNGNSSTPTYATVTWGGSAACGTCHKVTEASGLTSGSHAAHIGTTGVNGCGDCHTGAANDASSYNSTTHINRSINVAAGLSYTAGGTPGNGYGTCSAAACHGAGTPQWGGTLTSCGDCHIGTGDVDDFTFGNGTLARIDNAQWSWSGHGKTTNTYDISGNSAANLPSAANGGDPCWYCHSSLVTHNTATNPFRLANNNALGNGWNDACLVCHKTGSAGYDPDGAGVMTSKNATKKINKYHYGAKHGASNDGGSLCWDCHDPHGDRTSGSGNIFMIHSSVTKDKSDAYGTPGSTVSPVFTNKVAGPDYAKTSSPFNGICNVCHATASHYTSSSGDGHNSGQVCTTCHKHSGNSTVDGNAFNPDCVTCHSVQQSGTRRIVTGASGDFVRTAHHVTNGTTTEVVTVQACIVCHGDLTTLNHPTGAPADPQVQLRDQDTGTISTYNITSSAAALEPFCVSCHDSNGSVVNGSQPFNTATSGVDTSSPVNIGWTSGTMAHSVNDRCLSCHGNSGGAGATTNPKKNAHGSDTSKLLVYTNYNAGTPQTFCYNCHNGTVSTKNVQAAYGLTYNHATGSQNCSKCHDPHKSQSGLHVAGSANLSNMIGGVNKNIGFTYQYQVCYQIGCHGTSIYNKTNNASDLAMDSSPFSPNGTTVYRTYWDVIPNIQGQFATTNLAYHPLLAAGKNQPANNLNSNWDSSAGRKIDNATACPDGTCNGIDNTLVNGWESTSLVTCSDCHDNNSGTGARGPHGSNNAWIVKGMDKTTAVAVTIASGSTIYPNQSAPNQTYINGVFCVNCHRADIYGWSSGSKPSTMYANMSRWTHYNNNGDGETHASSGEGGYSNIGCKNCHGGGEVAGIHGSNRGVGTNGTWQQGQRFMNGNAWSGHTASGTSMTCYTGNPPAIGVTMSSCNGRHSGGRSGTLNYSY